MNQQTAQLIKENKELREVNKDLRAFADLLKAQIIEKDEVIQLLMNVNNKPYLKVIKSKF